MGNNPQPNDRPAPLLTHRIQLRIRYGETDQMGTFYNARPLDWFECGRTEILRSIGLPYSEMERRGVFLPVVEAHVDYLGRARYDDLLEVATAFLPVGRARIRCDETVVQVENGQPVVRGYTVHAFTNASGRAIRPPQWFWDAVLTGSNTQPSGQ